MLVVVLYYTSLSLDLVTVIPLYSAMYQRTFDLQSSGAPGCVGGCTWACESYLPSDSSSTIRYPTETCQDACTREWFARHWFPLSMRDVMAYSRGCRRQNSDAFQTSDGSPDYVFLAPMRWLMGESRPPHAMYVRYTPDVAAQGRTVGISR